MIDQAQVQKVAHLARLDLSAAEEAQFTTQLNDILDYFEQLNQLDTADVLPTTRAIDVSNVVRVDAKQADPAREEILEGAPDRETNIQGDFFKVPKIMGGD
jgi:aspartyl-tRNA(Asn)/glutamyl-tRNA(Gln) amidotransferase subunit C